MYRNLLILHICIVALFFSFVHNFFYFPFAGSNWMG